ncbi:Glutamyl-tRNA amidotransferase subunit A, mitochondrial [Irpex rosettiformis]|uniref:Glutamyl-tRNA amidotransferase subunit A, mitochondrial n=1 Tax=Irpex rosettiformis TaxID=378272 RepID=A0ACB8UBC8_9APHY|nr:Glutamyl-tRNA amidotransferase subunit A, mitochondrial [Irpex rosettiformis]
MLRQQVVRCRLIQRSRKALLKNCYATVSQTSPREKDTLNALVYRVNSATDTVENGPLKDVRVAVKDNICTAGIPTTCSSRILETFKPPYDATVVKLLREAGAPIVGKANCDEFGMGSLNLWSIHGPALNPSQYDKSPGSEVELRSAGGSSGGSAAAVAAGLCDAALGTDTGGSVRLPASYCGVVGLKPSYGVLSRWGVVSYADSLDCVGILGKSVGHVQRVFQTLNKFDDKDPTAVHPDARKQAGFLCQERVNAWPGDATLSNLRVGVPQEYFPTELSTAILQPYRNVLRSLAKRGAQIIPVSLPSTHYALSAYYVIASAEASSNLARYDGIEFGLRVDPDNMNHVNQAGDIYAQTRTFGFGEEVQRRILLGTYALTADAFDNYFLQAQRVRRLVRADFDNVFSARNVLSSTSSAPECGVDILLHPSAIRTAPPLVHDAERDVYKLKGSKDDLDAYLQDVLTVPASLAGLPAMSVPAGVGEDKWPVGVSIVGQWGCDEAVLKVGEEIEKIIGNGEAIEDRHEMRK